MKYTKRSLFKILFMIILFVCLFVCIKFAFKYKNERKVLNTGIINQGVKYSGLSFNKLTYNYYKESLKDMLQIRNKRIQKEKEEFIKKEKERIRKEQEEIQKQKEKTEELKKQLEAQKKEKLKLENLMKQHENDYNSRIVFSRGGSVYFKYKYNKNIPLNKNEQFLLFRRCQERGIDYKFALAIIKIESDFNVNTEYLGNYGYFQINRSQFSTLINLNFGDNPLNPYTNIEWGTYCLGDILLKCRKQKLNEEEFYETVLSIYNKGEQGYKNTGKAIDYINKHKQALIEINKWF